MAQTVTFSIDAADLTQHVNDIRAFVTQFAQDVGDDALATRAVTLLANHVEQAITGRRLPEPKPGSADYNAMQVGKRLGASAMLAGLLRPDAPMTPFLMGLRAAAGEIGGERSAT